MPKIAQEIKKLRTIKLSDKDYKEVCSFWNSSFTEWFHFLLNFAIWKIEKKETYILKQDKVYTQKQENINNVYTQKTEVKMNDKMQQFLWKNVVEIKEESKQPTPTQATKIRDINRLTNNWTRSHREDWEEYSYSQLMHQAGLSDFL